MYILRIRREVRQLVTIVPMALCLLAGCSGNESVDRDSNQPIQIAICDLDQVATELGLQNEMQQLLGEREKQLTAEVQKIQEQQQATLQKTIDKYGEKPTDDQKSELAKLHAQAMQAVRIAQANATNLLNQERVNLVQQVRQKLQPAIDKVAKEKGIRIVLTHRPGFLAFVDSDADITYDIVTAAKYGDSFGSVDLIH